MVEIRNYQQEDYPQVKHILELGKLFDQQIDNFESFERKIKQDSSTIIVAVENEKIVGVVVIIVDFFPFLFRLAVHPDFRKKGIGKELMQKGEEILKRRGYDHVNILVSSNDLDLQQYYQKQGYEKGNNYTWMYKEFK